jgi:hypothetical protein
MHRREERGRDDHVGLGRGADRRAARRHRQDPAVPPPGQLKPERPGRPRRRCGRRRRWRGRRWWRRRRRRRRRRLRRRGIPGMRRVPGRCGVPSRGCVPDWRRVPNRACVERSRDRRPCRDHTRWRSNRPLRHIGHRGGSRPRGSGRRGRRRRGNRSLRHIGRRRDGRLRGNRWSGRQGNVRFRRRGARGRGGCHGHRAVAAEADAIPCPEARAAPLTAPNFAHAPPPWLIIRKQRPVLSHEGPQASWDTASGSHSTLTTGPLSPPRRNAGRPTRSHGPLLMIIGFHPGGPGIPA